MGKTIHINDNFDEGQQSKDGTTAISDHLPDPTNGAHKIVPTDPDLAAASLTLTGPAGMRGSLKWTLPQNARVFWDLNDGKGWVPVSDQPNFAARANAIPLMVEGYSIDRGTIRVEYTPIGGGAKLTDVVVCTVFTGLQILGQDHAAALVKLIEESSGVKLKKDIMRFAAVSIALVITLSAGDYAACEPRDPDDVSRFLSETDCSKLFDQLREWQARPPSDRVTLTALLAGHVRDATKTGLTNLKDVTILYRIRTGEMKDSPRGYHMAQDGFIVGGKAAWAIEELLGVGGRLPEINEGLAQAERDARAADIQRYIGKYKEVIEFLSAKSYPVVSRTLETWQSGSAADRVRVCELLAVSLGQTEKLGLTDNKELIIPYRRETGDQPRFEGMKYTLHDLYISGGRAAWAVETLTGVEMPEVSARLSNKQRLVHVGVITRCIQAYAAGARQAIQPPPKGMGK